MEENKEMLELLKQIEKANRQQVCLSRVLCVLAVAAAVCCVVAVALVMQVLPQITEVVPQVTQLLPQIHTVVTQMQTVLGNLEVVTEELAAVDMANMVTNVDALVTEGQQSLQLTMEKLNSVDFETLNKAIEDLAAVIEPLSKLSNLFR